MTDYDQLTEEMQGAQKPLLERWVVPDREAFSLWVLRGAAIIFFVSLFVLLLTGGSR